LVNTLLRLYCNWFQFYTITQHAHRNIQSSPGVDFYSAHLLLERIYNEAEEQIDGLGEHIRGYGAYLPETLEQLGSGSDLPSAVTDSVAKKQYMQAVFAGTIAIHDNLIEVAGMTRSPELLGTNTLIGDLMVLTESWLYLLSSQLHMSFTRSSN
jgi:DNA-binding ferritin-like protein